MSEHCVWEMPKIPPASVPVPASLSGPDRISIGETARRPEMATPFGARLRSLDGLRGAAVLAVVAFHTLRIRQTHGLVGSAWAAVQESAWAGVDLFFVLSGFLITGILLDSRRDRAYFRNFYARRTLRIFPLYYAVLVVALLIAPAVLGLARLPALYPRLLENQAWLWCYLANFLQAREPHTLPGFGHFWSLAVEEQFYWFWPLIVFYASRGSANGRRLFQICLAVCCLSPLIRLGLLERGAHPWALRQYTFTRVDSLLFGALAATIVRDAELTRIARKITPALAWVAAAVLLAIGLRFGFVPFEAPITSIVGYSAFGLLFAALIFYLVTHSEPAARSVGTQTARWHLRSTVGTALFSNGLLRWFGKYSYGIYIFHWPVAQAVQNTIARRTMGMHSEPFTVGCYGGAVLILSSALAWCTWHGFEVRFLKLKNYFGYSEPAVDVSPAIPDPATQPPGQLRAQPPLSGEFAFSSKLPPRQ